MHYSGPDVSENDSAVTTDVCEDQNRDFKPQNEHDTHTNKS